MKDVNWVWEEYETRLVLGRRRDVAWRYLQLRLLLLEAPRTPIFDACLTAYHKQTSTYSRIQWYEHYCLKLSLMGISRLSYLHKVSFANANKASLSRLITYHRATRSFPGKHDEDYPHGHETWENQDQPAGESLDFVATMRKREKEPPSKSWSRLVLHGPVGQTPQSDRVTMCLGAPSLEFFYHYHHLVWSLVSAGIKRVYDNHKHTLSLVSTHLSIQRHVFSGTRRRSKRRSVSEVWRREARTKAD
jgi:hypothetical protein